MSSSRNDFQKKSASVFNATRALGDKWSPCLIFLLSQRSMRFSELQECMHNINPRTLSQRLDKFESLDIISKETIPQNPPHTAYVLTAKGQELVPILRNMIKWGDKYGD